MSWTRGRRQSALDRFGRKKRLASLVLFDRIHHFFGREITDHQYVHIGWMVERVITDLEQFRRNCLDAVHRSGYIDGKRMFGIQITEQTVKKLPSRIILIHADFLGDDPFFLFSAFLP